MPQRGLPESYGGFVGARRDGRTVADWGLLDLKPNLERSARRKVWMRNLGPSIRIQASGKVVSAYFAYMAYWALFPAI